MTTIIIFKEYRNTTLIDTITALAEYWLNLFDFSHTKSWIIHTNIVLIIYPLITFPIGEIILNDNEDNNDDDNDDDKDNIDEECRTLAWPWVGGSVELPAPSMRRITAQW